MAGIGFELKKLFKRKGFFASLRAFGYATVITTGPMFLGILLLLGILMICTFSGTPRMERELLVCMITYTLLASLTVVSFFSMVVTRFIADMLYEERKDEVLPSFWGSCMLMMSGGGILWLIFLLFSGATFFQGILLFVFFEELIITWHAMSYLTAIKDYKGIFISYISSIAVALFTGALLVLLHFPSVEAMLFAVTLGYGIMPVWDIVLLHKYFPKSWRGAFRFLKWFDKYRELMLIGFFSNAGLFAHLVIMWFSKLSIHIKGLFYTAPEHDVPAFLAFLTCLVTTVNFIVSVEVNFYPKYRNYNSLYNDKGTVGDIMQAESEMLKTLKTEIFYTAFKQLLVTALAIAVSGYVLNVLPLGFNETMMGYFRTLAVGYGLYAVGNMLMLILLYFVDYKGAMLGTACFAAGSVLFSCISLFFNPVYYGFGFLFASFVFTVFGAVRLDYYTKRLPYYILCVQPIAEKNEKGKFTRCGEVLDLYLSQEGENEKTIGTFFSDMHAAFIGMSRDENNENL